MKNDLISRSKFLSLVLRHKPDEIGLELGSEGWANVNDLISKVNITKEMLDEIVATNNKKRFAYSEDGLKIRASQGHSVEVDLKLAPKDPPEYLYHGTTDRFIKPVLQDGLKKMNRQHVHLSQSYDTAVNVGSRHGTPKVLRVRSKSMKNDGFDFFLSDNGVWLTDNVPIKYVDVQWEDIE